MNEARGYTGCDSSVMSTCCSSSMLSMGGKWPKWAVCYTAMHGLMDQLRHLISSPAFFDPASSYGDFVDLDFTFPYVLPLSVALELLVLMGGSPLYGAL